MRYFWLIAALIGLGCCSLFIGVSNVQFSDLIHLRGQSTQLF